VQLVAIFDVDALDSRPAWRPTSSARSPSMRFQRLE